MTTAPSYLLGSSLNMVQNVSLGVSFCLHYFSASSEYFLPKELSQNFAPIPGGEHATFRAVLFMLRMVLLWRSMAAPSRATTLQQL
jgi:hypothetical protein